MTRFGQCPVCSTPVLLKPKARFGTSCSPECKRELSRRKARRFREQSPEAHKENQRRYSKTAKRKESHRRWVVSKGRAWKIAHYAKRPEAKVAACLRSRLLGVIKGGKKSAKTLDYLGCSLAQLRAHLEALFKPGMTWDNHGRTGWHIDHRKPLASFSLVKPDGTLDETALRSALHFSNLQPLWYWENIAKADHLEIVGETKS